LFILSRQYNPRDTGAYREDDGAGRATKFASLHFSTDELPEQQRVEIWQDVFNHSVLHLEIKSLADEAFYSRAEFREFGGVRVGNCTVSAMDMRRKASHIGRETDLIGLYVNLEGTSMLRQLNRELTLNPGEATVILNTEPAALLKSEGRWFGIQLPRTTLSSLGGLEDRAAQLIPGNSTALRLLLSYLSVGQPELEMASPALLNVVSAHVSDLCSLAIGTAFRPQDVARSQGARAARLQAVKTDIAANLSQLDYSIAGVASRHGISRRTIQMLFEGTGSTFSEYLRSERLARAHQMLCDPHYSGWTITDIAFAAGFGDISYFNRTYRRRYGATPSEIRATSGMTPR
jgi:AraC-like DNA-binding protein